MLNVTYSKKSVPQGEVAVHIKDVETEVFTPRDLACPQVEPVVDDGQGCLLDLLVHVPDHCLRGWQLSEMTAVVYMIL